VRLCVTSFSEDLFHAKAGRRKGTQSQTRQRANLALIKEEATMLWTIFVILLVLWIVGLVSSYTMGGFIHLLLVLAVIVLIINLVTGRRTV
jgi:uncharacterized protein DUF5670